jgi:hypothetical protein
MKTLALTSLVAGILFGMPAYAQTIDSSGRYVRAPGDTVYVPGPVFGEPIFEGRSSVSSDRPSAITEGAGGTAGTTSQQENRGFSGESLFDRAQHSADG